MLTEHQKNKAFFALLEKKLEESEKQERARKHVELIEKAKNYNLPYRVIQKYRYLDGELELNPYYPLPAQKKNNAWHWWEHYKGWNDFFEEKTIHTGKFDNGVEMCDFLPQTKEKKMIWDITTEKGLQVWKKYFVRFLLPFEKDMKDWVAFDFFGDARHTEEQGEQRKQYYLGLINEYHKKPERYRTKPVMKRLWHYDTFEVGLRYMCKGIDENTPQEIIEKEKEYSLYLAGLNETMLNVGM